VGFDIASLQWHSGIAAEDDRVIDIFTIHTNNLDLFGFRWMSEEMLREHLHRYEAERTGKWFRRILVKISVVSRLLLVTALTLSL